jgi:cysteine desulfurase
MGKAMTLYNYDPIVSEMYYRLKQTLITGLAKRCPVEFRVNEIKGLKTLNNICNISFKGINGESLARLLDYDGFIVSTKSACKSGSSEPSKVLKAIDTPDDYLFGAIRISFSEETDTGVVGMLVNAICEKISVLIKINDWRNER